MSWQYDRSKNRVKKHLDSIGDIDISKLTREAELETLLTETCCRQIYGVHVYVPVTNFSRLVSGEPDNEDSYKKIIRALHIYQREIGRIVESAAIFDGVRIHFQGSKLHALFYRPIRNETKIATQSVLLQLVVKDFVRSVFNPAFEDYDDFEIAGGADIGEAIGTRNGLRGSRELLFLGAPANHAAKIVSTAGRMRLTANVYAALPVDLQELCSSVGDDYQIQNVSKSELDELTKKYGIGWNREKSAHRVENDKILFPISNIAYSGATTKIQLDDLSITNNKRILAASVFGDVTGFTAYIDRQTTEADQKEALRNFHVIRREMARVIKNDFDGLHVQFQGDRVQGMYHMPKDEKAEIATISVDAATGLQSSMEDVLKQLLTGIEDLKMAVGVDQGTTLASKTGTRGHRDRLCVADAVEEAAACEERCSGGQIGVTKTVYDQLPERLRKHFNWNRTARCFVADNLTVEKVERATVTAGLYQSGMPLYIQTGVSGVAISVNEVANARKIVPSKPYVG